MTDVASIVRPDVSYAITDPADPLYDHDSRHPDVEERFEWAIRLYDDESKAIARRHRRERQELKSRQSREIRADAERLQRAARGA